MNIFYITENLNLSLLWNLLVVFATLIIILTTKKDRFFYLFSCFIAITVFSTIINNNVTISVIFNLACFYSLVIYLNYAIKDFGNFFTALFYLFTILIIVNSVTILIGGIGTFYVTNATEYLLGRENNIIRIIFPGMIVVYIYTKIISKSIVNKFILVSIMIIGCTSIVYLGSATGIVITFMFLLVMFLPKKSIPTFKTMISIYMIFFISVVVMKLHEVFLRRFITDLLNNDITFSGRTEIWSFVGSIIKENWLIGVGYGNTLVGEHFLVSEEHNLILQILVDTGIVGLVLFLSILISSTKKLKKNSKSNDFIKVYQIISFGIIAFLIIGIMESRLYDIGLWLLVILAYNIPDLENKIISSE